MSQIEHRLNASARFLGYGGRLELINSVLSSLTTYHMCSIKLQKTVIKYCDRARRHCLWAKKDEDGQITCNSLAAWQMVCRPKKHGRLGIVNLELQNKALLIKQLHKFYCNENVPWIKLVKSIYGPGPPHAQTLRGSFWWRDIFSLVGTYKSITTSEIGSGSSVLLWKDFWADSQTLSDRLPHLLSYATNEDMSVQEYINAGNIRARFSLPLSAEAHDELQVLNAICSNIILDPLAADKRSFVWGSAAYTPARFYRFVFSSIPKEPAVCSIWKSKTMPKLKVFSWLLFMDRLNTKDIMDRKSWNVEGDLNCVLCEEQQRESRDHLFFGCEFAKQC
jgi:hypothetical protein